MKNRIKYLLLVFFSLSFILNSSSEEIKFDNIRFQASKIEYLNEQNLVKASGNIKIFLDNKTEISGEKFTYDRSDSILTIEGNVEITDSPNEIYIRSNKIKYFREKEILKSDNKTKIIFKKNYIFNLTSFNYNRRNSILYSKTQSEILDSLDNNIKMEEFRFEILNKLIKSKFVNYTDKENNSGKLKNAIINVSDNSIIGNEFEIDFNNSLFGNPINEPRLKSKSVIIDNKNTTLSKAVFTSCKKNNTRCPPWMLKSEKIYHDKDKKMLNYKNAWLNVYDVPIVYFPKFFHPDPTVKRQSGFLVPSFSGSKSLGQSFSIPYYNVIAENKDLTFSPRIFFDGSTIIQNEYRQVNRNSELLVDASLLVNSSNNEGTKSHFFLNNDIELENNNMDESELTIKLERVSNDTYLKKYNVSSPINSNTNLNSKIKLSGSKHDFEYMTSIEINENLDKIQSDRYEYIFPNFSFTKNLNNNFNLTGNLDFISSGHSKLYDTNIKENILINDLKYLSSQKINNKGYVSNYKFLIKNFNSEAENSSNYKSDYDSGLMGLFEYENKLPLIKESDNFKDVLTPKILFKYSPNKTKNMKNSDRRIDTNNIFSFNRISSSDSVEGGESLTIGAGYRRSDDTDRELFGFDIATAFRTREDKDIPISSTLGQKRSDIFGNIFLNTSDNLNFNYQYSLDNNVNTINFHSFKTNFKINNFFNTFEYFERSDVAVKESFYKNTTGLKLDNNNSIKFETRKNKITELTEYYNLIYEYHNDCLIASVEYDKEYYTDADLKPEETLLFKLTIVPFTSFENIRKVK